MKRFWMIIAFVCLLFSGLAQAQVNEPSVGRWWWGDVIAYIDSVTAHRVTVFQADSMSDQTIAKFALEEDIEIERVSFFSQTATAGDTTGIYFYEGTRIVDSLIVPTGSTYLEFTANITLTKDSSFVAITVDDTQWGGTVTGGRNAVLTIPNRVKRQ